MNETTQIESLIPSFVISIPSAFFLPGAIMGGNWIAVICFIASIGLCGYSIFLAAERK